MANYCDVEYVGVLLDQNFDSETRPTSDQVDSIIGRVTNDIDFTLKSIGVTVQPTDSTLLGKLEILCSYGVACQVGMSYFGNNDGVDDTQPGYYCEAYKEGIQDIKDNPSDYGAVTGDSTVLLTSNVLDGTDSEDDIEDRYIDEDYEE